MMWTAVTVILCCCVLETAVAGQCGVSAPEKSLKDIASECDHEDKGREAYCVAAMHRFCGQVKYHSSDKDHFGVSQEAANGLIGMACVHTEWRGDVSIKTLAKYNHGCSKVDKSQHRDCLSAIHKYCSKEQPPNNAGISQEVGANVLQVHCFQSSHTEKVSNDVLKEKHPGCTSKNSDSAACFAAASRLCQVLGHSGGITQEADAQGTTVACYKADFTNTVFVKRTSAFYTAQQHGVKICSIDFDIDKGVVLGIQPDYIKKEVYNNTNSADTTLHEEFIVSQDETSTNTFTTTQSYEISAELTFTAKLPYFESSLKISRTYSRGLSLTKENTVTTHYSQASSIDVPPGKIAVKMASLTKATLEVPWSGKLLNDLGAEKDISGKWLGVNKYDLIVTQRDNSEDHLHLQHYNRGQGPINAAVDAQQKIVKIEFDINEGTELEVYTEDIIVEIYDNTGSDTALQEEFIVSKDVTDTNTFTFTQSYEISAELTFTARLPFFKSSLKMSATYSKGLSLTKKNTVTTHYSQTKHVYVPPGGKLLMKASLTKARMEVPWSGKLLNALGAEKDISGKWFGVNAYDLTVTQDNNLQHYNWGQSLTPGPINADLDTQESSPASPCSNNLALCPSNSALCSSSLATCTSPDNIQCACAMATYTLCNKPSSESC